MPIPQQRHFHYPPHPEAQLENPAGHRQSTGRMVADRVGVHNLQLRLANCRFPRAAIQIRSAANDRTASGPIPWSCWSRIEWAVWSPED